MENFGLRIESTCLSKLSPIKARPTRRDRSVVLISTTRIILDHKTSVHTHFVILEDKQQLFKMYLKLNPLNQECRRSSPFP